MIVAATLLARYAADESRYVIAFIGLFHTFVGAAILIWTGYRYDDLHGPLKDSNAVVHPAAVRLAGVAAITVTGAATLFALAELIIG